MTAKKPKPGTIAHELGLAKDEPTAHLQVPLPRSVKERFAAECEREGETMSTITRRLIVRFLGGVAVLLFAVVGSGGCGGSVVPVHLDPGPLEPDEAVEVVEEAGLLWGREVEFRALRQGAVTIKLRSDLDDKLGETDPNAGLGCRPWIRAIPEPVVVAHELGHALGLYHDHESAARLMYAYGSLGVEVTDEELVEFQDGLDELCRCTSTCR